LISGCQDNQYSSDGTFNSLFTANLLAAWNNGHFKRNYKSFHKAIIKRMPPDQTPNYYWWAPTTANLNGRRLSRFDCSASDLQVFEGSRAKIQGFGVQGWKSRPRSSSKFTVEK